MQVSKISRNNYIQAENICISFITSQIKPFRHGTAEQNQKAVTADARSKQLLHFAFRLQNNKLSLIYEI